LILYCIPFLSLRGIRDDGSGSSHSGSPHLRVSPPGFENYDQKDIDDDDYWEEENWDVSTEPQPIERQQITETETEKQTTLTTTKTIPTQTKIPQTTTPVVQQNITHKMPPTLQPTLPQ
jgi:hypothetical protein